MENNLGEKRVSSLMRKYPPKDRIDFLRGYPSQMYSRRCEAMTLQQIRSKCASERKICFSSLRGGGLYVSDWHENLYGFTRVVVHGVDSICAVARTEDVERVMCQGLEADRYMSSLVLKNALIYEAEDLALPRAEKDKMTSQSFEKPFIAVSLPPGTNNGHEVLSSLSSTMAFSDEYDVAGAMEFCGNEIRRGTIFTFDESLKAAICSLEYLFGKRFEANEIKVFYVKNHSGRVLGGRGSSEVANEFPARAERSIEDHLSVIKTLPRSGGSSCRVS